MKAGRLNEKKILSRVLLVAFPFFLLVFLELILRLFFGYPSGLFAFAMKGERGLYPRNSSIPQTWGPVPYVIKTNSFGFRGEEFAFRKPEGTVRIAAIGDSVTDGFFVDNEGTYPTILQNKLNKHYRVEVLNAAFGGGSIDKQLLILREIVLPLKPDVVLLTFVTNDIWDIRNKNRNELVNIRLKEPGTTRFVKWFLTKTALGEALFDAYMRIQSRTYRGASRNKVPVLPGKDRYQVAGGNNYAENSKRFLEKFGRVDGLVLTEPFSSRTIELIQNYLFGFQEFHRVCKSNNIRLALFYFPSYSQVYDSSSSFKMRDMLASTCTTLNVPFLDLTDALRTKGRAQVLHLAPVDFHLNPAGNEVIAEAITQFLQVRKLL